MAEREVHLRDYLAIIRKHDFIVVVSFLLVFGSALIVSLYIPRVYEASAMIEIQPTTTPSGLSNLMQNVMSRGVDQVSMETICKRFTSRTLLAETIRNLKNKISEIDGDQQLLETPESLIPKIRAKIVPDTRMIEVAVRMRRDEGGSQRAAIVTNELISVVQAHRTAKTDAEMGRRRSFINSKIEDVESLIDSSDHDIRQFLKDGGDDLVWSARADYVLTRLSNLIQLKEESEAFLTAQQRRLSELKVRLAEEPEWTEYSKTFSRDILWDKDRTDLADLERELVAARAEFGEKNPKVRSLEAQISNIREEMKTVAQEVMSAKTESRNPTYQSLLTQIIETELNLIAHEAQREVTEKMLNELDDEKEQIFSEMPERLFQLDKMRREVGYEVDVYKTLLEKKLEAEIWASENSDDSLSRIKGGVEIVDMAQAGGHPVSPRGKFISAIAGLVGLAIGLAMAFLAEYFENTYQSPEEIKADLDVPILGIIPESGDGATRRWGDGALKAKPSVPASLLAVGDPTAESFRTLITNIEFSSPETPHAALLVTSSGTGEGKSFITANLAVAMAQGMMTRRREEGEVTGRGDRKSGETNRVILVDCDMRKAIQHKIFDIDNEVGLANLLVGNADLESVIQDTSVPNLKLISCGPTPPNPVELLKSGRMAEVLSQLRGICDVLLCDSPPVLPVADALVLASQLDGVLFTVDLKRTPREVIRQAWEQLSQLDVLLLGLVCNRVGAAKYGSYYYYRSPSQSSRKHVKFSGN